MKPSRIHRLLQLVTLLRANDSLTVDELAEDLQVSRRTVFRDLNMLELAHIPYYFDREGQRYRISKHFFLPSVNLDLAEALSMMLLAVRQNHWAALPWPGHARRAAMKLEGALPAPLREHIGSVLDSMDVRPAPSARHEGVDVILDDLIDAVTHHQVCRLVYISFYERKQMRLTVHPLRLAFMQRAWYLLAWTPRYRAIRTFKMARVKRCEVTDKTFTPPEAAQVEAHFGQAWCMIPEGRCYDIHLRFDPQVAGNVAEVRWHDSQRVEWRDDGSIDFHARVDGLGEVLWWILGYGDKVRVVAPAALARKVRSVATRMTKMYSGGEG